jgi:hypothetical protein
MLQQLCPSTFQFAMLNLVKWSSNIRQSDDEEVDSFFTAALFCNSKAWIDGNMAGRIASKESVELFGTIWSGTVKSKMLP